MTLTERHVIKKNNPLFPILDELCFKSKNLYNSTLYKIRQEYFNSRIYLGYYSIQKEFQKTNQFDYRELPIKTSQQTMMLVDKNFKSFFAALKEYQRNPKKFKGRPKIPGYLDPIDGRFVVVYTYQSISKKELESNSRIKLSGVDNVYITTKVQYKDLCQVRIIPRGSHIVVEVVYKKQEKQILPDNHRYAGIDLGVDNLVTLTTNIPKDIPVVWSGKKVKSWNHKYNKDIAYYKGVLDKTNKSKRKKWSKRLERITLKRELRINDYFHKISREIVNHLVSKRINTLVIGNNKGWKQDTSLGKIGNQNFVQIPFMKLISMLEYKCKLEGINFYIVTEEYTSKCSFLDLEVIGKHDVYSGKRVHRGLFRSGGGKLINADVNGSLNILRKCKPGCFDNFTIKNNGVRGVVVHPIIRII